MLRKVAMLAPLSLAALLMGVVTAKGQGEGKLTGPQIEAMLKAGGLKYIALGEGKEKRLFMLPFESQNHPNLVVFVELSKRRDFVSIHSPVMEVPVDAPASFYRRLLQMNEEVWQAKFGLSKEGMLYFEFEVPSRILDAQELITDVHLTAQFVDKTYPALQKLLKGEEAKGGGSQT